MNHDDTSHINLKHSYQKLNYFAICGHLLSAVSMIFLLDGANSVTIPYTETYLTWIPIMKNATCPIGSRQFNSREKDYCLQTKTSPVSCQGSSCYGINLGWLVISFHLLSFCFQLAASLTDFTGPILGYQYSEMVKNKN